MKTILLTLTLLFSVTLFSQNIADKKVNTYNIATLGAVDTIYIPINYKTSNNYIGLQIEYKGVTGTANGDYSIYMTNATTVDFELINVGVFPYTISTANEVAAYEKTNLNFTWMPIIFNKNGMTGGQIIIHLNLKN
jgi:hypothetical protein